MNRVKRLLLGLGVYAVVGVAYADYTLNMPVGVTSLSREVYGLHMTVIWICLGIAVVVFGTMFYTLFKFRKSEGAVPAKFDENTKLEILWTIIPFLILIGMAIPATRVMIDEYDTEDADLTIKVTGYQWKWRYEYLDEGIDFLSNLDAASNAARRLDSGLDPRDVPNYLLEVDHPLVIPVGKKIRFLFTAADVLHAWWVPEFGWKRDAIPGYITDAWAEVEKPGVYRGQCAELCGKDHGFMPIVVVAKAEEDYRAWVNEQQSAASAKAESAGREWNLDELIAKGEGVYQANCASCHQVGGEGIPGTFPAITGSPVATGDLDAHIDLVLVGKGMMPGFGEMLDPVDLAAVITFQRNGLGNDTGDSVQSSDIQSRSGGQQDEEEDDDED